MTMSFDQPHRNNTYKCFFNFNNLNSIEAIKVLTFSADNPEG